MTTLRIAAAAAVILISTVSAEARHHRHHYLVSDRLPTVTEKIIGGRPAGCPHAYCGCGARLYLGIADVRLNLASNWLRYYSGSTPVAVWSHHIAIIERMTGPRTAILRDYNSGGGLSRIHERSLAGARIIGTRYASR